MIPLRSLRLIVVAAAVAGAFSANAQTAAPAKPSAATPPAASPSPATPANPSLAAQAEPAPDTLLATVNGQKITQLDVTLASEDLGPTLAQQLKGKARDAYVLDYLVDSTLVAQKAKQDKLDQTPDFAAKVSYAKDKVLMEALLTVVAKSVTDDATLHKIYDEAAKAQKPEEEIHARHILVATEADAQAVLKRLKAGEDFAKVAKETSKDSGADGGDLGWFTRERMVPEFADAAFKLKDGQISDPVKSQFGWHIIQVEGHRTKQFPPFNEVRDQIVRYSIQKAQSDLILDLRKNAKIERTAAAPPAPDAAAGETPAK